MFIDLKHQTLKELNFSVNVPDNDEIHLESQYSFNTDYDEDRTHCVATLILETHDIQKNNKFNISIKLVGFFECEGVSDNRTKQEAHIQAYTLLFPYAQSIIANLTMNAGLPPLMIPRDNIAIDNVSVQ